MHIKQSIQHVDKAVVRQAGYQSHKEMKKSMFVRAKVSDETYPFPVLPSLLTRLLYLYYVW